jgi:chromosome segregation ATPase
MTQTIEVSLVDVLNKLDIKIDKLDQKIDSKFEHLEQKIDNIQGELTTIKIDVATLKEGQTDINKRLDTIEVSLTKRIDGIDTRLNTLIAVTFTVLLGIIAKLIFIK